MAKIKFAGVYMLSFRKVVDECYLGDLGFVGPPFSWKNGQEGGDQNLEG